MGIRETLNQNKPVAIGAAVVILIGAGAFMATQIRGAGPRVPEGDTFFTVDDGKTLFKADSSKLPPFDHEGKQAYRAHVLDCGGQQMVAYLSRYTEQAKKTLQERQEAERDPSKPPGAPLIEIIRTGSEVKRPGSPNWVRQSDPAAGAIIATRCPNTETSAPKK